MFKNRALQVSMVTVPNKADSVKETLPLMSTEEANELLKDHIKRTVILVGTAFAVVTVINTICNIAEKNLTPHD
jgi:hypothetical protein